MELTLIQILYYMWSHKEAPKVNVSSGLVSIHFAEESVLFAVSELDYEFLTKRLAESSDYPFWHDTKPFDVIAPYKAEVLKSCEYFKKGLLTLEEFTSIVNAYNNDAEKALGKYEILYNEWRLK